MKALNEKPKVELLAPAGNMEKLEIVLHYGADAVYLAGKAFSLRNFSANFSLEEMATAIDMVHEKAAKAYVAVNIFPRNKDLAPIEAYLKKIRALAPDGIIAADPAVIASVQRIMPSVPIHLSTQANTTNAAAVQFWKAAGVSRINTARELTLTEIRHIAQTVGMEIETFVHGAMCVSYSGRCLLSSVMAQRSSNEGLCCQPCRFRYAVVEETRPGRYFPISEDGQGSYIFNSKDLCMIAHIPELISAGIHAFKIEGRMKSIHYAATSVKVYREAIDRYYSTPDNFKMVPYWQTELDKVTSRGYCTGFFFPDTDQVTLGYGAPCPSDNPLAAKVLAADGTNKAQIEARNQIRVGDIVEIVKPKGPPITDTILGIRDEDGIAVALAQPGSRVTIEMNNNCERLDLLRRGAAKEGR